MVYHNLSGTTSSDLGIGNGKSTSKVLRATATVLQVLDDAANLVPIEVGSPTTDDSAITRKYFLDHSTSAITGAATTIVTILTAVLLSLNLLNASAAKSQPKLVLLPFS